MSAMILPDGHLVARSSIACGYATGRVVLVAPHDPDWGCLCFDRHRITVAEIRPDDEVEGDFMLSLQMVGETDRTVLSFPRGELANWREILRSIVYDAADCTVWVRGVDGAWTAGTP